MALHITIDTFASYNWPCTLPLTLLQVIVLWSSMVCQQVIDVVSMHVLARIWSIFLINLWKQDNTNTSNLK
jgi:hypothetical protein